MMIGMVSRSSPQKACSTWNTFAPHGAICKIPHGWRKNTRIMPRTSFENGQADKRQGPIENQKEL